MYFYNDAPRIKDVFLYIRQSTDERDGKQVRSKGDQQSDCEDLAAKLGLNIVEIYSEDRSARAPNNRPAFTAMLKALSYKTPNKRRADGILSWHPNRLSRNALEAGMILQMIDDDLIKDMYFPAYSFHNDPSGKEHLFMEFARAKGYSDNLSVVVVRGSSNREKEGAMLYPVKFGYMKKREVPENPKLCSLFPIPCEINFPIIKQIFELRSVGFTVNEIILQLKKEGIRAKNASLNRASVSRWLRDSFYFGRWIVNTGKKNERVIDLTKITLSDGTSFTPVISEPEFWRCHANSQDLQPSTRKTIRHINPIHGKIYCNHCNTALRPAFRNIKRVGGVMDRQLGYECRGKSESGISCSQPRVKAEVVFSYIEEKLRQSAIGKREYHQFTIGIEHFLKKKREMLRCDRIKLSKEINRLEKTKTQTLRQRASLIEAGEYLDDDKQQFISTLKDTNERLIQAKNRYHISGEDVHTKISGYKKFVELCQNLHETWANANHEQKRTISKKILLNLTIEDSEIRSATWISPFQEWINNERFPSGGAHDHKIEPWFDRLWKAFTTSLNKDTGTSDA